MSAQTGTAVQKSPTAAFSNFMDKLKPQMALALPKHLTADRMARLAMTAFSTSPALRECDQGSIAASIMVAAQLGLEPGVNGAGYLIPYKGKCTFVPGWRGLVDLVSRSGRATVWTGVVFANDYFKYQLGDSPKCVHKPSEDGPEGEFTHVYAIGRVRDSEMPVIEVWGRNKVSKHLKQYNKVGQRHYANESENNFEMYARKVALLQVIKYMPSSVELNTAIEVSHASEAGRVVAIDGNLVVNLDGFSDSEQGDSAQAEQAPVVAQRATLPDCPEAKLAAFIDDVAQGRRSDEEVINMLLSRHTLSGEQMVRIKAAKVAV